MPKTRKRGRGRPPGPSRERNVEARRLVLANGYRSLAHGCRAVDLDYVTLQRWLRDGMPENPGLRTVEKIQRLGLLELFRRSA